MIRNECYYFVSRKKNEKGLFEKRKKMTEKDYVELMYKRYGKTILNMKEMSNEVGKSYSLVTKMFGGKDAIPEDIILRYNLIPKWRKNENGRREWTIFSIAKWLLYEENK